MRDIALARRQQSVRPSGRHGSKVRSCRNALTLLALASACVLGLSEQASARQILSFKEAFGSAAQPT